MQPINNTERTLKNFNQEKKYNNKDELYKEEENKDIQQDVQHQQEEEKLSESQEDQKETTPSTTSTKHITDPHQFLQYATQNKKIKIMDECNAILPNIYLKDISLHYKGPMQDKAYSRNYEYYINIRRGNTLCQIYDQNQKQIDLFFCRRGMKKFFDLEKSYLETDCQNKLNFQHQKYRQRIFEKIDQVCFDKGQGSGSDHSIHLYSIFKENGQHCQITYVKRLNYWLFASKNVSILANSKQDLQKHYQHIRFYWAKIIAEQFLSMIENMQLSLVQSLKEQLQTKTLLGEHCGNQKHQHITKYKKVEIIFYALVEKTGEDHAMPVEYTQEFLAKYGFRMSTINAIRNLKDKNSVYKNIYKLLKETAEGTMDQYGQGSVLYVVEESPEYQQHPKSQRTISMCKLKTAEYLMFRRMREMLKFHVSRKSTANSYQKYRFDIENIVKHYFNPPKELKFYEEVAKLAFKEASKDTDITQTYLRYKFVEFMQRIEKQGQLTMTVDKQSQNSSQANNHHHLHKLLNKKIILISLPRFTQNKLQKYAKTEDLNTQYIYRNVPTTNTSSSLHILHMIPRLPTKPEELKNLEIVVYLYTTKQIQQIEQNLHDNKNSNKSHMISFLKSQDKKKSLELLNTKIQAFYQNLRKKSQVVNVTAIAEDIEDKDTAAIQFIEGLKTQQRQQLFKLHQDNAEESQNQNQKKKKLLHIIYPLMLPGSGKSFIAERLKKHCIKQNITYNCIKGDQIRKKYMQKVLNQKGQIYNPNIDHTQTFHQVKEQTLEEFESQFITILEKFSNNLNSNNPLNNSNDTHNSNNSNPINHQILFIDKVFGPQIMQKQIQKLRKLNQNIDVEVVMLLTDSSARLSFKDYSFPFSLQNLLICLKRCLQRQDHETMTTKPEQICNRFLWYLKLYNNLNEKKLLNTLKTLTESTGSSSSSCSSSCKSSGTIDIKIIKYKTIEQHDTTVHSFLKRKLEDCLQTPQNEQLNIQLLEEIYKNMDYLQDKLLKQQNIEKLQKFIDKLFTQIIQ